MPVTKVKIKRDIPGNQGKIETSPTEKGKAGRLERVYEIRDQIIRHLVEIGGKE